MADTTGAAVTDSTRPAVMIYRDHLLPVSNPFVRDQAESLRAFVPFYVGSRRVGGVELPADRTIVVNSGNVAGRVGEAVFKVSGWSPGLTARLGDVQPCLVHAHFGPDGVRAMPLARKLRVPLVVTFHGYDATVADDYALRSAYGHRQYIRRRQQLQVFASAFIAVSDFIRSKLIEQGFPADRVHRHYIGIDTDAFTPDPAVQREDVVLFAARLVEKKGCEYFVRAMGEVQRAVPDVTAVIIGDGPLRSRLERDATRLLRRFRFLGAQPREKVRAWMNRAKVFCVPSVVAESGDAEAFGIVFAEAQAMGTPVVSFATGGIPEAVDHGRTGFLAPAKDVQTLAGHIVALLKDGGCWEAQSTAARARVEERFSLRRQNPLLEEIYAGVVRSAKADARLGRADNGRR